ncbi:hypothetical protein KXD40_004253 [Peronospora effusa]|uniref:BED-type domain-containing protein n=1 Tax=Peronospora effusa TaxID=542832 RepID=A0A3M6VIA8_9STRA|nr:hypothetical protein DD238_004020 [Peronospora effusa]RQM14276.1 hypothetical protein DD237_005129 [Peronospora effusa]UIZ28334.1 hypothetical protein KXD40_004253 [Peronospora effusa]CAI5701169.1 unnamed protein product [Peronospora effusa]
MELEVPPLKRTGRPVHPLWTHFHRGEKRNRYHYHAFCSYCVARHGIEQVPPTRGVSAEMLRHLESCPNCPHKVLDTVKELCGQRERTTTPAKKNANGYSGSGNRLVNEEDENQVLLLDAMAVANATVDDDAAAVIVSAATPENVHMTRKRTGSETLDTITNEDTEKGPTLQSELNVTQCTKRGQIVAMDEDIMTKWRTTLLQTAVATGISLSAFQENDFQKLLQVVSPMRIHSSDERISSVGSVTFLKETAAKFARTQLERVKENMLNSRIPSGLTLSVSCWCTLDLQHLVAFTLVNLKGDAACVRVEDVGNQHTFTDDNSDDISPLLLSLTHVIEDVLLDLNEKNICVIGIVTDSATALSAAKRVCRSTRWRSLLVVPSMFTLLTSLVGGVLTHDVYRDAVGQLVELAAYFTNARLQALLRSISGDNDARIPLPTKYHWFSFVACLTKVLQYSDAITVLCTSQDDRGSVLAPSALRELVLGNNCQIWKTLRGLDVLLAPLREAYNIMFQSKAEVGENNSACDNNDEYTATVQGGLTLAHVMYQFGRMSQQYAALAEPAELNSSSSSNDDEIEVVARRLHELLDTMWQRYDLPTMVLAYVFDFHMESERLDLSNSALQWKAVSSYFQLYFQRWFCQPQENQAQLRSGSTVVAPISSNKAEAILNAYQLRQFPFDAATTSDHTDMASFYSFVSDSHPEICALCCRIYGVVLACADLRRVIRGIGFVPSVAQTTDRPKQVELLLHVGYATSVKKTRRPSGDVNLLSELIPASHPEELLCSHQDWKAFSTDWKQFLDDELAVDELEQLQTHDSIGSHQDKNDEAIKLSLNQLFFEVLPPLPSGNFTS